jgi:hypothetical protein
MLYDSLTSAMAQTYDPLEIVVVDNHSDDETAEVARELARQDERVHVYVNERNIGTANYHMVLHYSRGEFIQFLNSDDMLEPNCVERLATALDQPGVALSFCRPRSVDLDLQPIATPPHLTVLDRLLDLDADQVIDGRELGNMMLTVSNSLVGYPSQVMWRRSSLGDTVSLVLDGLMVQAAGDVAHWLIMLGRGDAAFVNERLAIIREHGGQESSKSDNLIKAAFDYLEIAESAAARGFLLRDDDRCAATAVVLRQLAWRIDLDQPQTAAHALRGIRVANARLRANLGGAPGLRSSYQVTSALFIERGDGSDTLRVARQWLAAFGDRTDVSLIIAVPSPMLEGVQAALWPLRLDADQPLSVMAIDNIPMAGAIFAPGPILHLRADVTADDLRSAVPEALSPDTPWPQAVHYSVQRADRIRALKLAASKMAIDIEFPSDDDGHATRLPTASTTP